MITFIILARLHLLFFSFIVLISACYVKGYNYLLLGLFIVVQFVCVIPDTLYCSLTGSPIGTKSCVDYHECYRLDEYLIALQYLGTGDRDHIGCTEYP